MKLRKPIPPGRSFEQVWNQFLVEKEIAARLKAATREERKRIYACMYDELFAKVPDHPRLARRTSDERTRLAIADKLSIVGRFLSGPLVVAEFAAGDCRLAFELAKRVKRVIGIDISDQRNPEDVAPDNFELIVYDGYVLDGIESDSVDLAFSDQLIEHLHPEDTRLHFEMVKRILKPGGKYVLRTPHALTGPHDISAHFSDEPEGMHLKEWTYGELLRLVKVVGYSRFHAYWHRGAKGARTPPIYYLSCERMLSLFPGRTGRGIARWLLPSVTVVAFK
jgi:SAM-dependent methyltransferase